MIWGRHSLESAIAETEREARRHVELIAGVIGERHVPGRAGALEGTAKYVEAEFRKSGYQPAAQEYQAVGNTVRNVIAERRGSRRPARVWVLGAHYDSVPGSPGADDNGSAVAGLLEVARLLKDATSRDTVRFVAFANEEPPFYKTALMGSRVYAQACRARGDQIAGMVNLEMIGCFSDERGSQRYPSPLDRGVFPWVLPRRGNFIAFVGNGPSWRLTWRCRRLFRRAVRFPSMWLAAPQRVMGVGMSDHWSFWEAGYPAVMVTDTSFFRNRLYHTAADLPETLNFPGMAKVVVGVAALMRGLSGA